MGARKVKIHRGDDTGAEARSEGPGRAGDRRHHRPGPAHAAEQDRAQLRFYARFGGVPRKPDHRPGRAASAWPRRGRRQDLGGAAAAGRNPLAEERAAKEAEAGRITFGAALEEYIDKHVETDAARQGHRARVTQLSAGEVGAAGRSTRSPRPTCASWSRRSRTAEPSVRRTTSSVSPAPSSTGAVETDRLTGLAMRGPQAEAS